MADPHVTIPNTGTRISYSVGSTPSTGPFLANFAVFSPFDLKVYVGGALQALNATYTVALTVGSSGGYPSATITLLSAVTNTTVELIRDIPIQRTTDIPNSGAFLVPSINNDLDRGFAIMQDLDARKLGLSDANPDLWDAAVHRITNVGAAVDPTDAATLAQVAAQARGQPGPSGSAIFFNTMADVQFATIDPAITRVYRLGRTTPGIGGAWLERSDTLPGHSEYVQNVVSGKYWQLSPPDNDIATAAQLGIVRDPTGIGEGPDQLAVLTNLTDFSNNKKVKRTNFQNGILPVTGSLPPFTYNALLQGEHSGDQGLIVMKRFVEPSDFLGVFRFGDYGGILERISVQGLTGSGGSAFSFVLQTVNRPNLGIIELTDCYVSGLSTLNYGLYMDGQVNKSAGAGIRSVRIHNCHYFVPTPAVGTGTGIFMRSIQHAYASNVFIGFNGVALAITGVTGAPSDDIVFASSIFAATVTVSFASRVHLYGPAASFAIGSGVTDFSHTGERSSILIDGAEGVAFTGNSRGNVTLANCTDFTHNGNVQGNVVDLGGNTRCVFNGICSNAFPSGNPQFKRATYS